MNAIENMLEVGFTFISILSNIIYYILLSIIIIVLVINALTRLQNFLSLEEKKILINSSFMVNFNYRPLNCVVSLKKIKNLQKLALRYLHKSYNTSYEDLLLKYNFSLVNVKRLRALCVEIFKTLNSLNPSFMKEIFSLRQTDRLAREKNKWSLDIPSYSQEIFGRNFLTL